MSTNDITGQRLVTPPSSDAYRTNYDAIFKPTPAPTQAPNAEKQNGN